MEEISVVYVISHVSISRIVIILKD